VRFCRDPQDARKAIEALKAILAREGGVDWSQWTASAEGEIVHAFPVATAQWKKLGETGDILEAARAYGIWTTTGRLTKAGWVTVMNELGERIRAAKKAGA
jgi:hypothetical protein